MFDPTWFTVALAAGIGFIIGMLVQESRASRASRALNGVRRKLDTLISTLEKEAKSHGR